MFAFIQDSEIEQHKIVTGHVGMPLSDRIKPDQVTMVQADGNELISILNQFINIPVARGQGVMRWYGSDAQFIAANWRPHK